MPISKIIGDPTVTSKLQLVFVFENDRNHHQMMGSTTNKNAAKRKVGLDLIFKRNVTRGEISNLKQYPINEIQINIFRFVSK